jgi:hypothetical protein
MPSICATRALVFISQRKATLHEISRVIGLHGKTKGFDGEVERPAKVPK